MHTYRISLELRTCITSSFIRWARSLALDPNWPTQMRRLVAIYLCTVICEVLAAEYCDIFAVFFLLLLLLLLSLLFFSPSSTSCRYWMSKWYATCKHVAWISSLNTKLFYFFCEFSVNASLVFWKCNTMDFRGNKFIFNDLKIEISKELSEDVHSLERHYGGILIH